MGPTFLCQQGLLEHWTEKELPEIEPFDAVRPH